MSRKKAHCDCFGFSPNFFSELFLPFASHNTRLIPITFLSPPQLPLPQARRNFRSSTLTFWPLASQKAYSSQILAYMPIPKFHLPFQMSGTSVHPSYSLRNLGKSINSQISEIHVKVKFDFAYSFHPAGLISRLSSSSGSFLPSSMSLEGCHFSRTVTVFCYVVLPMCSFVLFHISIP